MRENVLIISDLQAPFNHKHSLDFLKAVKNKFKTTYTVCIGDETDNYWASSYPKSSESPAASQELKEAIEELQKIYKVFPQCSVINSNHLDRIKNSAKYKNIPSEILKPTNEIFKAPKGWTWSPSLKLNIYGQDCFFVHGRSKDLAFFKSLNCNLIQGHFHESMQIIYFNPNKDQKSSKYLRWSMIVGCLIDDNKEAFGYNKNSKQKPIHGCGVIFNGIPVVIPMLLDHNGNWTGKL
jgi:hypothetical protein